MSTKEVSLTKYLLIGQYTASGAAGLLKESYSQRTRAAEGLIASLGGTTDAIYYSYGENDYYAIVNLPDDASVVCAHLNVLASGTIRFRTIRLFEPAELDRACELRLKWTPPGA